MARVRSGRESERIGGVERRAGPTGAATVPRGSRLRPNSKGKARSSGDAELNLGGPGRARTGSGVQMNIRLFRACACQIRVVRSRSWPGPRMGPADSGRGPPVPSCRMATRAHQPRSGPHQSGGDMALASEDAVGRRRRSQTGGYAGPQTMNRRAEPASGRCWRSRLAFPAGGPAGPGWRRLRRGGSRRPLWDML